MVTNVCVISECIIQLEICHHHHIVLCKWPRQNFHPKIAAVWEIFWFELKLLSPQC